jgi:osmotically-inducible protein OsmY
MKTYTRIARVLLCVAPIAVLASSNDRKIEQAARASYNYRTVLERHVSIESRDGVVTLSGTVEDKDDKALAADTVADLPGVERVDNEIVVKSSVPEHSDAWIALKVRSRLLVKANVSAATTNVSVKDGIVTLAGSAENAAQKELTEAYAKDIDDVKAVKNDLVIKDSTPARQTIGEIIDDASITSQVKYTLLTHRSTRALKTKIETKDGVVAVTGEAVSDAEKALVTKLVHGVRGVKSVGNAMTVKS